MGEVLMGDRTSEFYSARLEENALLVDQLVNQQTTVAPAPAKPTICAGLVDAHMASREIVKQVNEIEQLITGDSPNAEKAIPGDSSLDDTLGSTLIRLSEAKESLERIRMAIVGNADGVRLY